jgi:hypothetical protein
MADEGVSNPPNSGDVSTTVTPAASAAAPQTTNTAPATAPQLSQGPAGTQTLDNLPVEKAKADSWGAKVYHGVLNALGGSNDVSLARDPTTGKMVATAVKSGPGQQWKRIISGALTGAAGGNAAAPGRGFAGGFGAVTQQRQAEADRQRQAANEDFDAQQKLATENANRSLIASQVARNQWEVSDGQNKASEEQIKSETELYNLVAQGGPGTKYVGHFPTFQDFVKVSQQWPDAHDHHATGNLVPIRTFGPDGKFDGLEAWLVTPDWQNSKNPEDYHFTTYGPPKEPGGKPTEIDNIVPANSMKNGDLQTLKIAQSAQLGKDWQEQQRIKEEQRRTGIEAGRAATEASIAPSTIAKNEADTLLENAKATAEAQGGEVDWGPGGQKGFNSWHDKNVTPALQAERTYRLASNVYNEYRQLRAQGKDFPTGAQSVQMLSYHMANTFGAVKGARITKDMIQQHMGARSISDSALTAVQKLTSGGKLSPAQWDAYFSMVGQNRDETWRSVLDDAQSLGRPNDYIAYPQDLRQRWGLGAGRVSLTQPNQAGGAQPGAGQVLTAQPTGSTGKAKSTVDGKLHWTDSTGKDYGRAE